jgi:hypothetical protein
MATPVHDNLFVEGILYQPVDFLDRLLQAIYHIRFIGYLFKQLPTDTLGCIPIQDQWCQLDLLFHQLITLHCSAQQYEGWGVIPNHWLSAFADDLSAKANLVNQWHTELGFDLEHITKLPPTVSVARAPSPDLAGSGTDMKLPTKCVPAGDPSPAPVGKRTRSHYRGSPFSGWLQRRR